MRIQTLFASLVIALLSASGCNRDAQVQDEVVDELPRDFVTCPTERPEACIQIYQPVCALVVTGEPCVISPCPTEQWQTRGNSCTACSDESVRGYVEGECATNATASDGRQ